MCPINHNITIVCASDKKRGAALSLAVIIYLLSFPRK